MGPDASTSPRTDQTRERALVERARVDPAAFGELYDQYLPRIHLFIARRVGDPAVAEDLTAMRCLGLARDGQTRKQEFEAKREK